MRIQIKIVALAIITIAFALGAAVMPAMAAGGESEGNFTMNNAAPTVYEVLLRNVAHNADVTSMDPQTEYSLKIVANDTNTLDDMRTLTVVMKRHAYDGVDGVQDQATFTWTSSGDAEGTWALDGTTGSSTWHVESILGNSEEPGTGQQTATSGTWYLNFKPAKTAKELNWNITVTPADATESGTANAQTGISMNLYTEIASIDPSFSFGAVALDSTTPMIDGKIDPSVIANGAYLLQSMTNTTWETATHSASLTSNAPTAGQMRLLNNNTATSVSANAVTTGYLTINGYGDDSYPTSDTGTTKPVYMWLEVASEGIMPGTYSAQYYYQIVNLV